MNKETKKALEGSILKWKRIVRSTKAVDRGDKNCPLCHLHFNNDCVLCPVQMKTLRTACNLTPYRKLANHRNIFHKGIKHRQPHCKECLRLAREELKFLESLRED